MSEEMGGGAEESEEAEGSREVAGEVEMGDMVK